MAKVTSIRLDDSEERMLAAIKNHLNHSNQKCSDTKIFIEGLRIQYERISIVENQLFKQKICDSIINAYSNDILRAEHLIMLFNEICYLLEVKCYSDSQLLKDEFLKFINYASERAYGFDCEKDENEITINKEGMLYLLYDKIRERYEERRLENYHNTAGITKTKEDINIDANINLSILADIVMEIYPSTLD